MFMFAIFFKLSSSFFEFSADLKCNHCHTFELKSFPYLFYNPLWQATFFRHLETQQHSNCPYLDNYSCRINFLFFIGLSHMHPSNLMIFIFEIHFFKNHSYLISNFHLSKNMQIINCFDFKPLLDFLKVFRIKNWKFNLHFFILLDKISELKVQHQVSYFFKFTCINHFMNFWIYFFLMCSNFFMNW